MKSSLKKLVSLMLVVVMIVTTNNFDSFSLTLDTLVRNEIEINKERNKNNNTKYYEEFLSEKKQYLLNDEGNASKATTKNNDIDKTVKDYLVDGNMDNINRDIESYIENNKSSNDTDNGNQVNDVDENENITSNEDNAINNKINDAANKSTNNDENKNDVQVDVVEDDIIENDIDSVVSDAITITNASNVEKVDDKLNNDTENTEITIDEDTEMDTLNGSQTFGSGKPLSSFKSVSDIKLLDVITFGSYPQSTTDSNKREPLEWIVINTFVNKYTKTKCAYLFSKKVIDVGWFADFYQYNFCCDSNIFTQAEQDMIDHNYTESNCGLVPGYMDDDIAYKWVLVNGGHSYSAKRPREILDAPMTYYAFNRASADLYRYRLGFRPRFGTKYDSTLPVPYWTHGTDLVHCLAYYPNSNEATFWKNDGDNTGDYVGRIALKQYDNHLLGFRPAISINLGDYFTTKSKITWNRDGGNWKDKNYTPFEEYEEGKITSLPTEKDIIKTGYKFDGWYINTDRTKVYKEIPATQTGAITLTAKWTKTITQYKINWQLKGGKFKEEYKHYETDKHNDTEDFVLPTEDMLNPPYGKIFKEWMVEGVATTSIAKEIKKDVTVEVNWAKSTGGFESFNIGTYKATIEDTEEEADLDWLILDKKDDKLLLMTKNVIDNVSYDKNGNANFKNSSIKKWLNNDFYDKTFDDKQKRNIFNDKNNGKVFLLTKEQFNEYFATNMQSLAEATEYAGSVNNGGEKLDLRGSLSPYWLMATEGTKVPYVQNDGILNESGIEANAKTIGVRPCIWVEEKKMDEVSVFDVGKFFRSLSDNLKPFFARFFGIIW